MAETLKLWLVSQTANNDYDTYDSAVVAAENEGVAQHTHPNGTYDWDPFKEEFFSLRKDGSIYVAWGKGMSEWTHPKSVSVSCIGVAAPDVQPGVVCASFNAG